MSKYLPDITLERFRLGELPEPVLDGIAALRDQDGELARRLEALQDSDAEIRASHPPAVLAALVRARVSVKAASSGIAIPALAWPAALTVLLLTIGLVPSLLMRPAADRSDDVRVKGDAASLVLYRNTVDGSVALRDNDAVQPGDMVRIAYRASEAGYGVIVSVDGRGGITQHLPESGGRAAALHPGATMLLGNSFELDAAPVVERFFLVTGTRAFDVAQVIEAVRRASPGTAPATLALPPSLHLVTFSLQKESRP